MKTIHKILRTTAVATLALFFFSCNQNDKVEKNETTAIEKPQQAQMSLQEHFGIKGKLTVVDFSAGWCQPCQMFKPEFQEAAKKLKGKAEFITIDVDAEQEFAKQYGIQSIPTVIVIDKNGKEVNRKMGYMDAEEVIDMVSEFIK